MPEAESRGPARDLIQIEDRWGAHNYRPLDVVVERAAGVWVHAVDGRRYLDCLSAYSALNQGHCHPRIVAALLEQASRVTLTSRAFRNDQLPRFCADTLQQMAADGITNVVAICLAPHNSRTSVGLYKEVLFGHDPVFAIDFVEEWHDRPLLIAAFAEKLRTGWTKACAEHGSQLPVLFTAHSVPTRTVAEGDPYEKQKIGRASCRERG